MSQILFRIPHEAVAQGDVSPLVAFLSPQLLTKEQLAARCQEMCLQIDFESQEPGELYVLPEVRMFLRRLHRSWPCAAFFCTLKTEFLLIHALCQLERLSLVEFQDHTVAAIRYEFEELKSFLLDGNRQITILGLEAGFSRQQIRKRQQAFCSYFARHMQLPKQQH